MFRSLLVALLAAVLWTNAATAQTGISSWNSTPGYSPPTYPEACQGIANYLGTGVVLWMEPYRTSSGTPAVYCYYQYWLLAGGIHHDSTHPTCATGYTPTSATIYGCEKKPIAGEDLGPSDCNASVGNPCNVATANKFQAFTDFRSGGRDELRFTRYYNSRTADQNPYQNIGNGWTTDYSVWLEFDNWSAPTVIWAHRPDGRVFRFTKVGGVWTPAKDVPCKLSGATPNWTLVDENDVTEVYYNNYINSITTRTGYKQTIGWNFSALPYIITSVTDSNGRTMTFGYQTVTSGQKLLSSVTVPDASVYTYSHDALGKLTQVKFPGPVGAQPTQTYHYEQSNVPNGLTGITDENGVRFATWAYDSSARPTSSQHAGGAELTTISYNDTDDTRIVTNAAGLQFKYYTSVVQGSRKLTKIERLGSAHVPTGQKLFTYDTNGYPASVTDWNGNVTQYTFNSRGLETSRTEAYGTAQARTVTTTWDATYRIPTQIVEPNRTTNFTYTSGRLTQLTIIDTTSGSVPYSTNGQTRTWTYTYTTTGGSVPAGLLASVDGPRTDVSDVTTFGYDASGNLASVTNALSQQSRITSYDSNGHPLTVVDANGITRNLGFNGRGGLPR